MSEIKNYYQINKAYRLEKAKIYYQLKKQNAHLTSEEKSELKMIKKAINKANYLKRENTAYDCCCGGKYTHRNKNHHNTSQRHIKYIATLKIEEIN